MIIYLYRLIMCCKLFVCFFFFFFKQKTAYDMRISDWSSDVCSSDLNRLHFCGLLSLIRLQSILLTAPSNGPILRQITQVCGAQSLVLGRKAANYVLYSRPIRRSEERRVGKECVSKCRSRWSPYHEQKIHQKQ